MRRIFKLVRLEVGFLKYSIILIGIILVLFTGALLSVISVYIDVPAGMYHTLDKYELLAFTLHGEYKLGEIDSLGADLAYGGIVGLTDDVTCASEQGKTIYFPPTTSVNSAPFYSRLRALVLREGADFSDLEGGALRGRFPTEVGEVLISESVVDGTGATIGSMLTLGEQQFLITGIIYHDNNEFIPEGARLPHVSAYLIMDDETVLNEVFLDHASPKAFRASYERLTDAGYATDLPSGYVVHFSNIDLAETFFMAVSMMLGIMVFFILYTLMATFYRQRQVQICRLKLLGAPNWKITFLYCLITGMLVVIAVLLGTALSVAFNLYFMNLCTILFNSTFASHFHPGVPALLLGIMMVFTLLLFLAYQWKIGNTEIAQEIKHE